VACSDAHARRTHRREVFVDRIARSGADDCAVPGHRADEGEGSAQTQQGGVTADGPHAATRHLNVTEVQRESR
jgi:hypothetical protein